MQTTVIGTGNMARGIATRLLAGGHEVTLLGREAGKGEELAREMGTRGGSVGAGTVGDPVAGDVVVLAVPYEAAIKLVQQYGKDFSSKVIVDITNPVNWETFDDLVTPPESSASEEIQKAASEGVQIVKAFNTTFAGTLVEGQVAGQPLDVFITGDDTRAKETVAQLVRDGGLVAIDAGAAAPGAGTGEAGIPGYDPPAATGIELPERLEAHKLEEQDPSKKIVD